MTVATSTAGGRQNALAEIHFASIVDDDLTQSEEEAQEEGAFQLENVQSTIGVSIGEQQTRLTWPKTPAAEKAAALDETDGSGLFEGWDNVGSTRAGQAVLQGSSDGASEEEDIGGEVEKGPQGQGPSSESAVAARLPSPWRAGPKTFEKLPDHRSALRTHLQNGSRRRASSGGTMADAVRKYLPNLPSMPKSYKDLHFTLPSFSALSLDTERNLPGSHPEQHRRRQTYTSPEISNVISQHDGTSHSTEHRHSKLLRETERNTSPETKLSPALSSEDKLISGTSVRQSQDGSLLKLRRSNSEGSLLVYRTKSFASSLGDDSRFESVNEQVNSRLKAIRDSWQDANFKFPSPSLPNFGFVYRDDLFRHRNGSTTTRDRTIDATSARRPSVRGLGASATMRGASTRHTRGKRSSKDGTSDPETHPFFTQALHELEGDLVILGGYRGSILRSAEPPNRQLWVPIKVGLNLRKVDLEVPLEPDADSRMHQNIIPDGMLTHIGPVDISKRLLKRLNACENAKAGKLRVHNYGYDWRLSPHFLSQQMIEFLEALPCNHPRLPRHKRGAIVVAHSLGGLITRHVINQRPDLIAGVVYAGVPQRCINILGPLRNGDDVLFSSRVLTAQVNFTIRTSYALLPLDGKCFINKYTKEEYPVDFFNPKTWKDWRLTPCLAAPLPRPDAPKDSNLSMSSLLNAVTQAMPTFSGRKSSTSKTSSARPSVSTASGTSSATNATSTGTTLADSVTSVTDTARTAADTLGAHTAGVEPQMNSSHTTQTTQTSREPNPATTVTIPYDKALEYLTRTLAAVKRFKQELDHIPAHTTSNSYPPIAVIYGKSVPTVYGAKVESRAAIARADAFDELAFASGDGVVLARAAMVPEGYKVVRGGVVASERGHVTLLGDLEAVGRCLVAVIGARKSGVGKGETGAKEEGRIENEVEVQSQVVASKEG